MVAKEGIDNVASLCGKSSPSSSHWSKFRWGLMVLLAVLFLKVLLAQTPAGRWLDERGYGLMYYVGSTLQNGIGGPEQVTCIDFDGSAFTVPGGYGMPDTWQTEGYTSRKALGQMLDTVAAKEPGVIIFDLDVSPDITSDGKYLWPPGTIALLETALRWRGRHPAVPVYFGIRRTAMLPRGNWLVFPRYTLLAAGMSLNTTDATDYIKTTLIYSGQPHSSPAIHVPDDNDVDFPSVSDTGPPTILPGIATVAALEYRRANYRRPVPLPYLLSGLIERNTEERADERYGLVHQTFPINYRAFQRLYDQRIIVTAPEQLAQRPDLGKRVRNKIVIIGDGTIEHTHDLVYVESLHRLIPGVFVHACAADTLISAPLYRVALPYGIALSGLLSLALLTGSAMLSILFERLKTKRASPLANNVERLHPALGAAAMVIFFIVGAIACAHYGVILTDVYTVEIFLVLEILALLQSPATLREKMRAFEERILRWLGKETREENNA